jgi:hypothetical protein
MLIQLLGLYTLRMWAVFPTFRIHILYPPSGPKCAEWVSFRLYCDITAECRNCAIRKALHRCPLLGNGWLGTFPHQRIGLWKPKRCYEINTRFYGDVDSWRLSWYGTNFPCQRRSNKRSPWLPETISV